MKIRNSIWCLMIFVAMLITLVLWHRQRQPIKTPPTAAAETNVTPPSATSPSSLLSIAIRKNIPPLRLPTNTVQTLPLGKWEQVQQILSMQNDVPIAFYGRLEDQFASPVADAQISASIRIENGVEHTVKRFSLSSDASGFFTISGYRGQDLSVVPQKAGYVLASLNGGGIYSHMWPEAQRAHPDPNNPVVIKMWKLQGPEPLVDINQHYKLPYTNASINFDLVAGKIVPSGGDLKITVHRPSGEISERNRQDWGFEIETLDGGLMDSSGNEDITYAAPESGYEPSTTLEFSVEAHTWSEMFNHGFFVRSRNGKVYSKLGISFRINSTPDSLINFTFIGVANTNGSRNWEATVPR